MAERPQLRAVDCQPIVGDREVVEPLAFQSGCVDGFVASQVARGFSAVTIENGTGVLERFLSLAGKPAWPLTAEP